MNIGVFICDCGSQLLNQKDTAAITKGCQAKQVFTHSMLCTKAGLKSMGDAVAQHQLDRLVIGACSPARIPEFPQKVSSKTGIPVGAIRQVNLKEPGRVQGKDGKVTGAEAVKAINQGVAMLGLVPDLETKEISLDQKVLVVGGGTAGCQTAHWLKIFGYDTIMVESTGQLGGKAPPDQEPAPEKLLEGVTIYKNASLTALTGQIGSFKARVNTADGEKEITCGAVVLATGTAEPAWDRYTNGDTIVPIAAVPGRLSKFQALRPLVGLVLDLEVEETKASTEMVLNLAIKLHQDKKGEVYVFTREVRVAALDLEERYDQARDLGVNIIKYEGDLEITPAEGGVRITAQDVILNEKVTALCGLVGISQYGLGSAADKDLAGLTQVSGDGLGQLQDNNIHLFPELTNRPGVFTVGACRGQYYLPQIKQEAQVTAQAVQALLSQKKLQVELSQPVVDAEKCAICLTCIRSCPYKAMVVNQEKTAAESIPEVCQRCGICAGECPAKAITLPVYSDPVLLSQIE